MSDLFEIRGPHVDQAYLNIASAEYTFESEMRRDLQAMWDMYEPYADPDFRDGFARDPEARFWEMHLGCALLEAGKRLKPTSERLRDGGQPDICVLDGDNVVWIEAIAPQHGDGPDAVPARNSGRRLLEAAPRRQAQLRITSALWTKTQALRRYVGEGLIQPEHVRIVAIGGGRFGIRVNDIDLPLAISSVFPVGGEYVTINWETMEVVDHGFDTSLTIARQDEEGIPRTAFVENTFADVSAILWSRVSVGNMSRDARPLTCIHNPMTEHPMPKHWGVWDREFVAQPNDDGWIVENILAD